MYPVEVNQANISLVILENICRYSGHPEMATTKGLIPKVDIAAPNYEDVEQEYEDFSEVHILRMALLWSDKPYRGHAYLA